MRGACLQCAWLLLLPAMLAACGGEKDKTPPNGIPTFAERAANMQKNEPEPVAVPENGTFETVTARIKVVGLDGAPLKGMAPIATRQPNAFDEPVATGLLSNDDGETEFQFPGDEKFYIRAWDPEARYFANNYYDALPNTGNVSEGLVIKMAPGTVLTATLHNAGGEPLANTEVSAMLHHPRIGPWWPAKGRTDTAGRLRLGPVPPGQFTLRFDGGGLKTELPATPIPPAETLDLGTLTLR